MRLCSFELPGGVASYGVMEQDGAVRDVGDALRARYPDLAAVFAADALDAVRDATANAPALAEATLLPPIPKPDKILCIGLNYMAHIRETGRDAPAHPSIFIRYPSSVVGQGAPLMRPQESEKFDYEGELAVVIGRNARRVSRDDALSYVAGYSCFNDGSIRDFQRHTSQFWPGKSFDRSGSMGPVIVTADEFGDPASHRLETRLNGETMQSTSIGDLAFDVPALISYISIVTELVPGDVIVTGTPGGVGLFRDPPAFMKAGDRVEVEISGIGTLSNPVEDED